MEHQNLQQLIKRFNARSDIGSMVSINDLRDKEFSGQPLTRNEAVALFNFDRFRINSLNSQINEEAFHKKYLELQVMANLGSYQEFLKKEYSADSE